MMAPPWMRVSARWSQRSLRSFRMVCAETSKSLERSSTVTRPKARAMLRISVWRCDSPATAEPGKWRSLMVRRFWTPVNAGDRRQSWSRESWLRQARDKQAIACLRASALRGQLQITFQQPAGRTLGLTGVAEELAFEAVE